jgi:hypothetical protein
VEVERAWAHGQVRQSSVRQPCGDGRWAAGSSQGGAGRRRLSLGTAHQLDSDVGHNARLEKVEAGADRLKLGCPHGGARRNSGGRLGRSKHCTHGALRMTSCRGVEPGLESIASALAWPSCSLTDAWRTRHSTALHCAESIQVVEVEVGGEEKMLWASV